jgi:hypothetical protein
MKENELIPKEKFIHGESPVKIPNWRLIDSPNRPDCLKSEEGIEIYTTKDNIKFVRTPDERFENLHDFPYEPHYALIDGLRITKGQAHQRYANASHFIQDDIGVELANKVISFIKANPM